MLDLIRQRAQSWGVKLAFGIIIIVFVFWGVGTYDKNSPSVVATVNDQAISVNEFESVVRMQIEQIRMSRPDVTEEMLKAMNLRGQLLQMMVSRLLIEQEAKRLGIVVSPAELADAIRNQPYFHKDGKFDKDLYVQMLAMQGRTPVQFEADLARDMLQQKVREYVTMAVAMSPEEAKSRFAFQMERRTGEYVLFPISDYLKEVNPAEEELQEYFKSNQAYYSRTAQTALSYIAVSPRALAGAMSVSDADIAAAFEKGPGKYKLRQILLTVAAGTDEAAEKSIRERLQQIVAGIAAGKDFAEAAKEFSEDVSATDGGELGWVGITGLQPEVEKALLAVKRGGVSAIVRLPAGYAVFMVEATDPDWSGSDSVIKSALRARLGEEKALLAFHDMQNQAEDLVALGKPLDEIAAAFKVTVQEMPLSPQELIGETLGLRGQVSFSMLEGAEGTLVPGLLETDDGFIIARIDKQTPAGPLVFAEVRDEILAIVKNRQAARLAEAAAREALKEFGGGTVPAVWKGKVKETTQFIRGGTIQEFAPDALGGEGGAGSGGSGRALVDALFTAEPGTWLPRPYEVPAGAVIAMPKTRITMSDGEWQEIEERAVPQLLEAKKNEIFSAFMMDLGKKAVISLVNPQVLGYE